MVEKIGRYEIKEEIGRGGMATVYRAYDPVFERDVAIKVLPRAMLHDPQFRLRFEREAKTIAMLEHAAIVPVYDYGEDDGQPYFVMRYMTGGSLADRIKQSPLSLKEIIRILDHIGPALDEAHRRGIVHRDLKPGNILFDQHGVPYVSDFGIAKLTESQTTLTGSAIVGTPAYMCPEQAQGESVDGRADIYALGVILFEMLTGRQPYQGDTPMSVVVKHITEPPPHVLEVRPELPPSIDVVVQRAMAKDREERYATVAEMVKALKTLPLEATQVMEKTIPVSPRTVPAKQAMMKAASLPPRALPARKRSGGRLLTIFLFLLLLLACAGGLYLFRDYLPLSALFPATVMSSPRAPLPAETARPLLPTDTATSSPPTNTPVPTMPPLPTATEAAIAPMVRGGADLIAFSANKEIWVMTLNGKNLRPLTSDGALKHDLHWSPEGDSIIFVSGKCVREVKLESGEVTNLACFVAADFLEAFEISPDGTQVAISLNRELYVVPFDRSRLAEARSYIHLKEMQGCYTYTDLGVKGARWSRDGHKIALLVEGMGKIGREDMIRVLDISACDSTKKIILDTFPGARFTMSGFNEKPVIPSYDWDGGTLFLLNSTIRNEGFGFLYAYNLDSQKATLLDPVGRCCYRDARWSPDGTAVIFAYQDINLGAHSPTLLYYLDYGIMTAGGEHKPLPLLPDFFKNPREKPQPILRPARH